MVYIGSIRRVNQLGALLDAAKQVTDPTVHFLVWGDGDQRAALERRVQEEGITNVIFKGKVEKKYVPDIVTKADLNLIHGSNDGRSCCVFGISTNKMFDCLAAGKPILDGYRRPGTTRWSSFTPACAWTVRRRCPRPLPGSGRQTGTCWDPCAGTRSTPLRHTITDN